jgi:hypothetical protein
MQNFYGISRPEFHVPSNGALFLAVSQMSCTGKWIELYKKIVLPFILHFQQLGLNLQKTESAPFERAVNFGLDIALRFYI